MTAVFIDFGLAAAFGAEGESNKPLHYQFRIAATTIWNNAQKWPAMSIDSFYCKLTGH